MEAVDLFHSSLKDFQHQAGILAETVDSLSESFEAEADRETRDDAVQRLKEIHSAVDKDFEEARSRESVASYAETRVNLPFLIAGSIAKIIMASTTENLPTLKLISQVCDESTAKKPSYGTVMVCVGAKGLPDDVRVVSISGLARQSNFPKSEIIRKLQQNGCLLINQERFARLIDKLVVDIREGLLHLPILAGELLRAETLGLEGKRLE